MCPLAKLGRPCVAQKAGRAWHGSCSADLLLGRWWQHMGGCSCRSGSCRYELAESIAHKGCCSCQLLLQLRVHHGSQAGQQGAQAREEIGVPPALHCLECVGKVDQAHTHLRQGRYGGQVGCCMPLHR